MILLSPLHLLGWLAVAPAPLPPQAETQDEAPAQTAKERYDALAAQAEEAMTTWYAEIRAKQEAGEELPENPWATSPIVDLIPQFRTAAADYAGTEDAVPFHLWIVQNAISGAPEEAQKSFSTLCLKHAESEQLEPLAQLMGFVGELFEDIDEELANVAAKSPIERIRDMAGFALHSGPLGSLEYTEKRFEEAKNALEDLAASTKDAGLRQQIESKLQIASKFAIGMVAPDIVGLDLDGTEFQLSDYSGKVIFLDFWGDW